MFDFADFVGYFTRPLTRRIMKTFMAKKEEQQPRWFVIDANGKVLGKVAVRAANVLRGKVKPTFTPHVDAGDFVVVINAEKVRFTGNKLDTKTYDWYTHYAGGRRIVTAKDLLASKPDRVIRAAVKRMVPRNRLGRQQMSKLKIYAGPSHPHQAQQPQEFKVS